MLGREQQNIVSGDRPSGNIRGNKIAVGRRGMIARASIVVGGGPEVLQSGGNGSMPQ
jgi:hypothetical protein